MKFLFDMNLSPSWVAFLADTEFGAVHWSEIGEGSAPDTTLLQWAAENGLVLLTADLDFGAILAATKHHSPSVVQLRSDNLDPSAIGEAFLKAVRQAREELTEGALMSFDLERARLRILPLE